MSASMRWHWLQLTGLCVSACGRSVMSVWQLVQRFLAWIDALNFSSSTNNETAVPAVLVLVSDMSEWQTKQSALSMARACDTGHKQSVSMQTHAAHHLSGPRIAVQPTQQEIHAVVGKNDGGKSDDGNPSGAFALPAAHKTTVQEYGVDEPGDQRPGFLRIPAPIRAPGGIRPHRARHDARRQEQKPE